MALTILKKNKEGKWTLLNRKIKDKGTHAWNSVISVEGQRNGRGGGAVAGAQVQPLCVSEASLGHSHLISYFRTVGPL